MAFLTFFRGFYGFYGFLVFFEGPGGPRGTPGTSTRYGGLYGMWSTGPPWEGSRGVPREGPPGTEMTENPKMAIFGHFGGFLVIFRVFWVSGGPGGPREGLGRSGDARIRG
jgi:hypothetical protein